MGKITVAVALQYTGVQKYVRLVQKKTFSAVSSLDYSNQKHDDIKVRQ